MMENKKLTSIICLDLSAAFDTVNHSILLEVMESYFGITNTALNWESSDVKNRKFSDHIDGFSSNTKTINILCLKVAYWAQPCLTAISVP